MNGASFSVVPAVLEAEASRLEAAAHAVRDLREHPGVLRGRALDSGDDELAAALVGFASAWQDGLDRVASQATRWALVMRTARDTYLRTEHAVASMSWTGR
ncbi:hypothetical protein [Angustibacter luteus]|uniref:Excreted virulence factor EspC (Type VII ESX diderm) n=1 Tax=Angustibacter luteus TaxID=658456 RepID=A0ABW1JBM7_9ACTN